MSHIFISYSKRNKDYVYQLADFLQHKGFNIWIDRSDIEYGVDWWDAIVAGLRGAGASVVVMTPEAKASEWVKREVFLALDWKKPLFPLLLNGDNWELFVTTQYCKVALDQMPDDDFLTRLSNYVTPRGKGLDHTAKPSPPSPSAPTRKPIAPAPPLFDLDGAIAEFGRAYRATDWSQAQEVLGRVRASGLNPDPFDLNHFERLVQQAIEAEKRRREQEALEAERQRQYQRIVDFVDMFDKATVWDTLQRFWQTFPDYDPEQIAIRVRPAPPKPVESKPKPTPPPPAPAKPSKKTLSLAEASAATQAIIGSPFEWCEVPAGPFLYGDDKRKLELPTFWIAKYPITYSQFQAFVEAKDGITDERWWEGLAAKADDRKLSEANWKIAKHPRATVNWYQCMAFARWLSYRLGGAYASQQLAEWVVRLPLETEWEKAARGTDGREYPWGNGFDKSKCNTTESGLKKTTPVDQYPKGASPYGVFDMSGNVWEWCLNEYDNPDRIDISNTNSRVLRGGSWLNNDDVARAAVRYVNYPLDRFDYGGCRVVCVRPPSP